jgi:hypothetical protein
MAIRRPKLGIPLDIATLMAPHQGPEMSRAILLLYRSARQPAMAQPGRALQNAAVRPGLSLLATEDPYIGSDESRRRAADRAGARTEVLVANWSEHQEQRDHGDSDRHGVAHHEFRCAIPELLLDGTADRFRTVQRTPG